MYDVKSIQVDCYGRSDQDINLVKSILEHHDQSVSKIESLWTTYRKSACYLRLSLDKDVWGIFETPAPNKMIISFNEFFNIYNKKGGKSKSKFDY